MHPSSLREMEKFAKEYLDTKTKLKIIDIGSMDVYGGNYKYIFNNPNWEYYGLDLANGKNVDIVVDNVYKWNLPEETYDVVVSGQCIEHVEDIYLWIKEISRILKKGGIVCIIGPWSCPEHRYPVDCWRIFPDGMRFLLGKIAGLEVIKCFHNSPDIDCIGIAKKQ